VAFGARTKIVQRIVNMNIDSEVCEGPGEQRNE